MLIRTLLLVAVALAGMVRGSQSAPAPFSPGADSRIIRSAAVALGHQPSSRVIRWLRRQPRVQSVHHSGRTLVISFRDGTRGMILPSWPHRVRPLQSALRLHLQPLSRARAPVGKALVLEPFATELGPGPAVQEPEVQELQAAGYQVDYLYDTAVTVSVMATLSRYNVVYMRQHSDPFAGGDAVLATGQLVGNDPSVGPLIQEGSVVPVGVSGSDSQYYAITSTFIRLHEGLFPNHSLMILNGCAMLQAPIFWSALAGKNVGAMVSWNGESNNFDTYLSGSAFLNEMQQGLSVAGAISAIQQAGYGTSNVNGQQSSMGFLGDGSITLAEAATGSPPAVSTPSPKPPTPTPVPTRPVATPVPSPTAAAQPGPPLTVQVNPQVKPGTQQVIWAHSGVDVIIRVHTIYPNGDQRSDVTATDATGTAHVAYTQPASTITHGDRLASVTVSAVKDSRVSTRTVRYRIGFAPLDIAAQPRVQAVGHIVRIWVHTKRPHSSVTVALRFPRAGQVKRFETRTGALGWSRVRYRVGRFLKNGSNHTVVVRARLLINGRTHVTHTTFAIQ